MRDKTDKKNGRCRLVCAALCSVLLLSACAGMPSQTDELSEEEHKQVTALLGDLNGNTSERVENKLGILLHRVNHIASEREKNGDYEMSEREYQLWEKITLLLNKETRRQFGIDNYVPDEPDPNADYGREQMDNLKNTLSDQDWNQLNQLRNQYFEVAEGDTEKEYNVSEDDKTYIDVETEIRTIAGRYKELDPDALVLNLLDEKNQKPLGIFQISPELKAIYQDGKQNGLKSLSAAEQVELEKKWKATTDILPLSLFKNFEYFKVGGDGEWGINASVIPLDPDGRKWCMTVDPADMTDDGLFPYTAVHEMGHYITLNEKQVRYFQDEGEYYPHSRYSDWQCVAMEHSYLQAFYDEFWENTINDWATNPQNVYYYDRHRSEFVTEYASSECAEDLAECFAAYVFLKSADTPKKQEKLDFFDRYPEFRQLKKEILRQVTENKVYVNPEIEPK
ncbi:MAG: hypothetical protein RSA77_04330 [Clostridium sp.]